MRTIFAEENSKIGVPDTVLTQEAAELGEIKVKFPKHIKHRGRVLATIYGKSKSYPLYRVAWTVAGKRHMRAFDRYGEAKHHADDLVRDLAKGSQVTALTPAQARDALAALERLQGFFQSTGRRVSLLAGISEYCEAASKLSGRTLGEAVDGYLSTVASVKRKDIKDAVEEFIKAEEPRTKASDGQRAQVSGKYHYNRAIMLRRFADTFPSTAVCDLGKEHLDAFIASLGELKSKSRNRRAATSAKSRNHHRAAVRQFLQWAVRKDYLTPTHRLLEADTMRPERANGVEIQFYTPTEYRALLETAEGPMRAIVAIGGLAGLRTAELLRLGWADVWRVPGHIEITAGKAKTRQRRLVEICPALAAWLEQFRTFTSGQLCTLHEITFQQHFVALCEQAGVPRKPNGLRHAFCTYHFAAHANENLTAQQAGNSPAMVHSHYKGLATKAEAQKWFAVKPAQSAKNVIPLPARKNAL
jgi:integrase